MTNNIKKFLVLSDIHLEFGKFRHKLDKNDFDMVLLAGDIGTRFEAYPFILTLLNQDITVVLILGNHEYYNDSKNIKTMDEVKEGWKTRASKHPNFHFLDNEAVVIGNLKIIGSTFWSHIDTENYDDDIVKEELKTQNDLNCIVTSKNVYKHKITHVKKLTLEEYNQLHKEAFNYVKEELDKGFDGDTILLTHHPVLKESSSSFYDNNKFESQFYNNDYGNILDLSKIKYLVHGHIHETFLYDKDNFKNICNPRGYVSEKETNDLFDQNLVFEI